MGIPERLTRFSLDHPAMIGGIIVALSIYFALGIPLIERVTSVRTFLAADHESAERLDRHLATYGAGYPVVIAYSCDETTLCDSALDANAVRMAARFEAALVASPGISEIRTVASEPVMDVREGEVTLDRLLLPTGALHPDFEALASRAAEDPIWRGLVLGDDPAVGAIVIEISSSAARVQHQMVDDIRRLVQREEEAGWRFVLMGELIDFEFSGIEVEREFGQMLPLMVVAILVLLLLLTRSIGLTFATLLTLGIASLWTQGAMGWSNISINAVTSVTPSLVFAIGILDGVHFSVQLSRKRWEDVRRFEADRDGAIIDIAREIGGACILTSLTTMGAFLSFLVSGVTPLMQFGVLAAIGILLAFVLTFTLLPVVLVRLPLSMLEQQNIGPMWDALVASLVATVERRRRGILLLTLAVSVVAVYGVLQTRVEINPNELAGEMNKVSVWNRWVDRHLRDAESIEIELTLPQGASLADEGSLAVIRDLSVWLERDLGLSSRTRSILDPLDRLAHLEAEGDRAGDLPAAGSHRRRLALLEANDPVIVQRWTTERFLGAPADGGPPSRVRITAELPTLPSTLQIEAMEAIRTELERRLPPGWSHSLTGSIPIYLDMMLALQGNQLFCFALAGMTAALLMGWFFRSWQCAVIAMIPSALPCALAVGMLGLWDYGIDPANTMVATIIIGVAVDDSIHLLTHFLRRMEISGSARKSLAEALAVVGQPASVSSVVLAMGFWTLTLSSFSTVASFGFLAGLAILAALVADLYILPSLISSVPIGRWLHRRDRAAHA